MGKTMVYVTHDQVEALALADRVAVMSGCEVLQQFGTRNELYHAPANRFVADFIGEPPTNFFDAEIVEENGELRLSVSGSDPRLHHRTGAPGGHAQKRRSARSWSA